MVQNPYYASPAALASGVQRIEQISHLAAAMIDEFVTDVRATSRWPGEKGSYAEITGKQEREQREWAESTGRAVSEALVGLVDGTLANLENVRRTQEGVLSAIHDSGHPSGGTHSGKR
ncbi:hypothetical protein [Streptomyces tendae]|uniref:hypothetical protein n=1 Tax=Streptomyces tendae TaxID=1932 RepID=UPI003D71DD3D